MTAFRVTPGELQQLSSQVRGTAGSIESSLADLRARVMPVGAAWDGAAHERFDGLYAEWSRSADSLQQALDGISRLLGQAGAAYAETEQRIASSFAG